MNTMLSFKTISRGALTLLGALAIVCILLVSRTPTAAAGETVGRYTSDDPSLVSGISGRVHHVTRPIALRGLYVPLVAANNRQRLDRIFWLMKYREPNAAVLDVKDVPGVTYHSNVALAQRVSGNRRFMIDVHGLIQQFHDRRIYVICRMVAFYDPNLARARPGWAIHKSDGSNWKDAHGGGWLSPYANGARAHLIAIAEEAASNGCDELQLDYTRTPEPFKRLGRQVYPGARPDYAKAEAIASFVQEVRRHLRSRGIPVGIDVFGIVPLSRGDVNIGQNWEQVLRAADFVSPMVYPSHFMATKNFKPNAHPFVTIRNALAVGVVRRRALKSGNVPVGAVCPWIQGFTLGKPRYGKQQMIDQMRAIYTVGIDCYFVWNARGVYDPISGAFARRSNARARPFEPQPWMIEQAHALGATN